MAIDVSGSGPKAEAESKANQGGKRMHSFHTSVLILAMAASTICLINSRCGGNPAAITEVRLERTPCYGSCPVYSVCAFSDGRMVFHGTANTLLVGDFAGRMSPEDTQELMKAARAAQLRGFRPTYGSGMTDQPAVRVAIITERSKIVEFEKLLAPSEIIILEHTIDGIASRTDWHPAVSQLHCGA